MTIRTALASVVAAAIGFLPLAPREHVHEVKAPDGHHETVAHRHAESHRAGHEGGPAQHDADDHRHTASAAHHSERAHDTDHEAAPSEAAHDNAIDHADSVVTQIAAAFTLPQDGETSVPALEVSTLAAAPRAPTRAAHGPFVERLIHGPPTTPTAPRPPPSSTRL